MVNQNISNYNIMSNITLLRAIPDPGGGTSLGVIVVNISLGVFNTDYRDIDIISSGNLLLLGEQGVITSLNENVNGPFLDARTIAAITQRKNGTTDAAINGAQCLVSFNQSEYTGWFVVSLITQKVLLQQVQLIKRTIVVTLLVCLLLSILLSYLVTLSISKPLTRLKAVMNSFDEGSTDVYYSDTKKDDIGLLGEIFNNMLHRMNYLINSIYKVELRNREEEAHRKQAELDALQMQINPHFLYNTLDVIRWKVIEEENGEGVVSRMIAEFSDMLRLSTKRYGKLVELDHIKAYLKVISFSYMEDFTVLWDIEDESVRHCKITKLTLQPIVENAIVHGFAQTQKDKRITVKAYYSADSTVTVEIEDNGAGMEETGARKLQETLEHGDGARGLGLRNVNERIRFSFGSEYGLRIRNKPGSGMKVEAVIPIVRE